LLNKPVDPVRSFVLQAIRRGALPPGAKLPTERTMAAQFGVSRAAVRQALTVLEAESRVVRHVGRGTFVADAADEADAVDAAAPAQAARIDTSPSMLIEARGMIEVKLVELVVLNATVRDLDSIAQATRQMEGVAEPLRFERADAEFHRRIALATHNDLVIAAYDIVDSARSDPEWTKLKLRKNLNATRRHREVMEEHDRICAALTARDAPAAAEAMRQHLLKVRANLLDY
jgi:DNA-binding FadR family transcriptional regulator